MDWVVRNRECPQILTIDSTLISNKFSAMCHFVGCNVSYHLFEILEIVVSHPFAFFLISNFSNSLVPSINLLQLCNLICHPLASSFSFPISWDFSYSIPHQTNEKRSKPSKSTLNFKITSFLTIFRLVHRRIVKLNLAP